MRTLLLALVLLVSLLHADESYIQLPSTKVQKNLYLMQKRATALGYTLRVNQTKYGYSPFVGPFYSQDKALEALKKFQTYLSKNATLYVTKRTPEEEVSQTSQVSSQQKEKECRCSFFIGGGMQLVSASEESNATTNFLADNSPNMSGVNLGVSYAWSKNFNSSFEYEFVNSSISTAHNIMTTFNYNLYRSSDFSFEAGALLGLSSLNWTTLPVDNVTGNFTSTSPLFGLNLQMSYDLFENIALVLNLREVFMQHQLSIETLSNDTITIDQTAAHVVMFRVAYHF